MPLAVKGACISCVRQRIKRWVSSPVPSSVGRSPIPAGLRGGCINCLRQRIKRWVSSPYVSGEPNTYGGNSCITCLRQRIKKWVAAPLPTIPPGGTETSGQLSSCSNRLRQRIRRWISARSVSPFYPSGSWLTGKDKDGGKPTPLVKRMQRANVKEEGKTKSLCAACWWRKRQEASTAKESGWNYSQDSG